MIFIAGYHPVRKLIGPVQEVDCPNCSNRKHWLLDKTVNFISLFFIPIIPIKTSYSKRCPICNVKADVKDEELPKLKALAELNKEAVETNMSEEDYQSKLKNIYP